MKQFCRNYKGPTGLLYQREARTRNTHQTRTQPTMLDPSDLPKFDLIQDLPRTNKLLQYSLQRPKATNSELSTICSLCSMIFPFYMGAFQYVMSVGSSKWLDSSQQVGGRSQLNESLLGTTDVEQAIHLLQILSLKELWALYTCFLQSLHKFRLRHAGVNTSTLTVIDVLGVFTHHILVSCGVFMA